MIETISEEAFVSPISALVLVKGETTTFEDEEINFDNTEINSPTSSKKSLKIEKLLPILLMFVWASIASAIAAHKKLKK